MCKTRSSPTVGAVVPAAPVTAEVASWLSKLAISRLHPFGLLVEKIKASLRSTVKLALPLTGFVIAI